MAEYYFTPPPPLLQSGDLFAKFLWGQNFFLHLWGDKTMCGNNIYYYTFIISFLEKQPTPRKMKCLRIS